MWTVRRRSPGRPVGRIEVIIGCMFAGKTDELINQMERQRRGRRLGTTFKHSLDTRYNTTELAAHNGRRYHALVVNSTTALYEKWLRIPTRCADVIGIDEGQFFNDGDNKEFPELCRYLASKKTIVIVAGLNMDSDGNTFGPMGRMLAIADKITKLYAVCVGCGAEATHTLYNNEQGKSSQVLVGAAEYTAVCRTCWTTLLQVRGQDPGITLPGQSEPVKITRKWKGAPFV